MRQTNFSPRNISANQVERVVPNALQDFRGGPSVLRASRSPFHCIDPAQIPVYHAQPFFGFPLSPPSSNTSFTTMR